MTGRDAFLCTLLKCGPEDLKLIDRMNLFWEDVIDGTHIQNEALDFNSLLEVVIVDALYNMRTAIEVRISTLEAYIEDGIFIERQDELKALKQLNPTTDFEYRANYMCSAVYCVNHGDLYPRWCEQELEVFYEDTGFYPDNLEEVK